MKICVQCNTPLEADDRFCSNCGTQIGVADQGAAAVGDAEPSFVDLATERPVDRQNISATAPAAPIPTTPAQPAAYQAPPIVQPQAVAPPPSFSDRTENLASQTTQNTIPDAPNDAESLDIGEQDDGNSSRKNLYMIGAVICGIFVLGTLYYMLFLRDDAAPPAPLNDTAAVTKPVEEKAPATTLFAMTQANIRNRASTKTSDVVGKIARGGSVTGQLLLGEDGTSNWLELADGRGFISAVNLSETAPPKLTKAFADRIWTNKEAVDIWTKPDTTSALLLRAPAGGKLTLSGITDNDFIEVKMKQGGVGYIGNAKILLAEAEAVGPPIAMNFSVNNCGFGSELDGKFAQLFAKAQAFSKSVEDADYPDDDARNEALGKLANKNYFLRLERSFNGLTLSGIGQHYESTSVYFADPKEKVIAAFKGQANSNGQFPSGEETGASIDPTYGEAAAYGKTALNCGV
jgi:hypothetical protein